MPHLAVNSSIADDVHRKVLNAFLEIESEQCKYLM